MKLYELDRGTVCRLINEDGEKSEPLYFNKVDGMYAQIFPIENGEVNFRKMGLIACWVETEKLEK